METLGQTGDLTVSIYCGDIAQAVGKEWRVIYVQGLLISVDDPTKNGSFKMFISHENIPQFISAATKARRLCDRRPPNTERWKVETDGGMFIATYNVLTKNWTVELVTPEKSRTLTPAETSHLKALAEKAQRRFDSG